MYLIRWTIKNTGKPKQPHEKMVVKKGAKKGSKMGRASWISNWSSRSSLQQQQVQDVLWSWRHLEFTKRKVVAHEINVCGHDYFYDCYWADIGQYSLFYVAFKVSQCLDIHLYPFYYAWQSLAICHRSIQWRVTMTKENSVWVVKKEYAYYVVISLSLLM